MASKKNVASKGNTVAEIKAAARRKVGEKHNPKEGSTEANRTKLIKKAKGVECSTRINTATEGRAAGHFASVTIFGFPLSQVLRSAGKAGMSSGDMRRACDAMGLQAVRINTIRDKVGEGRNGEEVKYAALDKKQLARLKELAAE